MIKSRLKIGNSLVKINNSNSVLVFHREVISFVGWKLYSYDEVTHEGDFDAGRTLVSDDLSIITNLTIIPNIVYWFEYNDVMINMNTFTVEQININNNQDLYIDNVYLYSDGGGTTGVGPEFWNSITEIPSEASGAYHSTYTFRKTNTEIKIIFEKE